LTVAEGRKFGLVVGAAFLVLGAFFVWREKSVPASVVLVVGGMLVLAGLAVPTHLGPVYRGWMAFALAISKVTTPLLMGVIYFLVLTPSGFIARLVGHRPLSHGEGNTTYWHSRPAGARRGDMNHQF
jgi:hypothetical protein